MKNQKGQGLVEYLLIIGLVAVVVIVAVTAFSGQITAAFNWLSTWLAATF
ncbi:MAG TPA: Flp family type IVb pilin [Candidatus Omnitrophota bacterium]|nr:Flp family type IVb pilin [Candidatus Omnitrophota bacterium]